MEKAKRPTALLYCREFLDHETPAWHPERPKRLEAIIEHLEKSPLWKKLLHLDPVAAERKWVEAVHDRAYVRKVEAVCGRGGGLLDWGDTPVCRDSFRVALLAVGALLRAADAIVGGQAANAFCLPAVDDNKSIDLFQINVFDFFELVEVGAVLGQKFADIFFLGTGKDEFCFGIEFFGGDHGGQAVKISIDMGGYDIHGITIPQGV